MKELMCCCLCSLTVVLTSISGDLSPELLPMLIKASSQAPTCLPKERTEICLFLG